MKSISKITALLIMVAFVAISCGKYEEGPGFSLMPKSSRLINDWVYESKYINGVEQALTAIDNTITYSVQKDNKLKYTYTYGVISLTGEGTWEFSDSKESVTFSYTISGITYNPELVILRLTSKEFWAEETISVGGLSAVNEYHFVSK